jgi:type IV secretory pathway TraG/TraD family ATPase VirD4
VSLGPRRHTLSLHELARPLLTAEEVRRLADEDALVFVAGQAATRGRRTPYYADAELAGRCRGAPPGRSDRLAGGGAGGGVRVGAGAGEVEGMKGVEGLPAEPQAEAGDGQGGRGGADDGSGGGRSARGSSRSR